MGIGNYEYDHSNYAAVDNSLPLMGIGNIQSLARSELRGKLITPHGDWKLWMTTGGA